ncbi:uncharacterized protein LOC143306598 [Osmia lignaria lignaria]|uniref:uncharacterized protein LOC143306598 n=1 Tax=Osmia lignaria lignaria TaxID=1437193 RepID=UPI00402B93B4
MKFKDEVLASKPLHPSQHAYQNGKSTETALHKLVGLIEGALSIGESALCIFLDIEGAFDNTPHDAIQEAARRYNIKDSVVRWIHNMLTNRTAIASLGEETLGHHVTVFQAELLAIWACAKYDLERAHSGKHIYICNDSLAALRALHKVEIGSKLVRDCALTLRQLTLNNRVKLVWVPGHAGIPGNERANELARLGATSSQPYHEYPIGVSTYALKGLAKGWLNQEFTRIWHNANGMRHTRALLEGPSQKLGDTLIHLDRAQLRMLVGLMTGHWYTRKHLVRMGLIEESTCPRCEEEDETPLHVLLRCRELRALRGSILGTLEPSSLSISARLVPTLLKLATETQLPRHSQ